MGDALGDKYEGGRDLAALKKFVDENLGPSCGPDNMDLCNDAQKAEIEKFMAMDGAELEKLAKEKSDAADAAIQPDLRVIRSVVAHNSAKADDDGKDEL